MEVLFICVGIASFVGGYATSFVITKCMKRCRGSDDAVAPLITAPDNIASGNDPHSSQDIEAHQQQHLVQTAVTNTDIAQFKIYINNLHLTDINQLKEIQHGGREHDFNIKL